MDESNILPPRFVKFLIPQRTRISKMDLPSFFRQKYGDLISSKVILVLRNGEEVGVGYVNECGHFIGMNELFERFDCRNGLILAFQYNGGDNFWAHAITDCSLMESDGDIVDDAGCKFVKMFLSCSACWGLVTCPTDFLERFGDEIPRNLIFRLSNGTIVKGCFDVIGKGIVGLQQVFRYYSMTVFDSLLFTYYGNGVFDVSAFGRTCTCVEKAVRDVNVELVNQVEFFEIEVQHSHMLQYCHGVYILIRYQALCTNWKEFDCIKVRHGSLKWRLEVRKRNNRIEIHRGWTQFRTDLKLLRGDYCVFKRGKTDRRFTVEVYKKYP